VTQRPSSRYIRDWDIRDVKVESNDSTISLQTEVYWLSPSVAGERRQA
jgi:hypothetical protein